jgi:hypothetical protein
MIAKIAAFAVALLLVGATAALAAPPASENLDDSNEIALSQAAPPLYLPTSQATSSVLKDDTRDIQFSNF